ncbi:DUF6114 domain-containing protein [Leifsonia sp. 1010]|uniref:DUF6114 domain-containing protein n=1 Tax=Leifsonia sp. 1010 TaxID=2817769 RepID=UPI00286735CB|nr:DUF6114 domain-containing protein [Leifsonia sp. 1010]MDR6613786.1 hypothetical protein [Leifsonia sp. 1010]
MLLIVARAHANGPIATDEATTAPSARARFRAWRRSRPFVGGLLTAIGGVEMFFSGQLDIGKIHVQLGIEGLQATIIPILLVLLGILVIAMPAHRIFYGVIALAVAVYSLVGVNLGGFFIGMLLSSIGGILTVAWMPKKAETDAAGAEADDDAHAAGPAAATPTASPAASPTEGTIA